jgi:hypothetical protein
MDMSWNKKYRSSMYDPTMAYLTVTPNAVTFKLSDYIYHDATGFKTITLFSQRFSIKKHKTIRAAIIAAKKIRNQYAPQILGDRFMEYGPRPRRFTRNNESGTVGVCDCKDNRFKAYWNEESYEGGPRFPNSESVNYGPQTEITKEKALEIATGIRKENIDLHYPSIDDIRAEVYNDPDVLDIMPKPKPANKSKTKKLKRAA